MVCDERLLAVRFEELQTVAVRVTGVETTVTGEVAVPVDGHAGGLEPLGKPVDALDEDTPRAARTGGFCTSVMPRTSP
jgi:hypothetical protein